MGEIHHGDHVRSVCCGPLLHYNVPGAYPSLYLRLRSYEIVRGIAKRGREHVLVFIVNPK